MHSRSVTVWPVSKSPLYAVAALELGLYIGSDAVVGGHPLSIDWLRRRYVGARQRKLDGDPVVPSSVLLSAIAWVAWFTSLATHRVVHQKP